jgi:preprotein translocase subunit SecF
VQLKFEEPIRIEAARNALEAHGVPGADVQEFVGENRLLVRIKTGSTIEEQAANRIIEAFNKEFPENRPVVESTSEIGPIIGQQLKKDAVIAIMISLIGIILYISARFEFRFGLAAALAMLHDVLVVLGLFYLFNKEITLLVSTALLTLAG